MGETYTVTLLCSVDPAAPNAIEIREGTNDQWNFCGFVLSAIRQGYLVAGDVLVLDNAPIHHGKDSKEALQRILDFGGVKLIYLPTYSPELNPCEMVFGNVKRQLREYSRGGDFRPKIMHAFASVQFSANVKYFRRCLCWYPEETETEGEQSSDSE